MAEYIERAAATEFFEKSKKVMWHKDDVVATISSDKIPTADVVEIRHGEWLPQVLLGTKAWDCSECKTLGSPQWKWCPVCGAKMDGKGDSE